MANQTKNAPYPGTKWFLLDTTIAPAVGEPGFLGAAMGDKVGSFLIQVEGTSWSGSLVPQGQLPGAIVASVGWIALAYENLNTGAEVAAGTAITVDGIYRVLADHGMLVRLDYTHGGTSVDVLVTGGAG
jgi:hypothetical protein